MIGSDLEGADLESRVASWAASAISDDAAAVRAVLRPMANGWRRPMWPASSASTPAAPPSCTQYMYKPMPEQSGGGCSGI